MTEQQHADMQAFREAHPGVTDPDEAYKALYPAPTLHDFRHAWWDLDAKEKQESKGDA